MVHRARFLFEKWFKGIAVCSEDAFKWMVSTAERQLTYPEGSPTDNDTYAKGGSGDDIDTVHILETGPRNSSLFIRPSPWKAHAGWARD